MMIETSPFNVEGARSSQIAGALMSTSSHISVDVPRIAQTASTGNEKGGFFPPFLTAGMPKMSPDAYIEEEARKAFTKRKIQWVLEVTANQKRLHRLAPAFVNILAFEFYNFEKGYAYPGIPAIARKLGAGQTAVKQAISSLEEHGHLIVQRRGWRQSHYYWRFRSEAEGGDVVVEDDHPVVGRISDRQEARTVGRKGDRHGAHVRREPDQHGENTVSRTSVSHGTPEVDHGAVGREAAPHKGAHEDGNIPKWDGKPTRMLGGNPTTIPERDTLEVERGASSASLSTTFSPSATVVGGRSICDAEEKEERLLEGAALPSATGSPCDETTPPAASHKDHPHPENPSSSGTFSEFWQAYPPCWPGADDPFSGESLDEQNEAEAAWTECEGEGDDLAAICEGARAFASHFERITASIEHRGGWPTPSDFLREEMWMRWLTKPDVRAV
ncbi:hypothetical protein [Roseovarius sp.]|uniref:hypothetical protein n=1 Tax=Roseovarius sp. TaxID=1486281 RepID=UPI003BAD2138